MWNCCAICLPSLLVGTCHPIAADMMISMCQGCGMRPGQAFLARRGALPSSLDLGGTDSLDGLDLHASLGACLTLSGAAILTCATRCSSFTLQVLSRSHSGASMRSIHMACQWQETLHACIECMDIYLIMQACICNTMISERDLDMVVRRLVRMRVPKVPCFHLQLAARIAWPLA